MNKYKVFLGIIGDIDSDVIKRTASLVVDKPNGRVFCWTEEAWLNMENEDKWEIHEYIDGEYLGDYQYACLIQDDSFEVKGNAGLFRIDATVNFQS
jgi:hypothetical protein